MQQRKPTQLFSALTAALALAALLGSSCEDDESTRTTACRTLCTELERCDDRTDELGCFDSCRGQTDRSDLYLDTRARCSQELSCNQWASEVDEQGADTCSESRCALSDCTNDALQKANLSSSQSELCKSVTNKLLSCDKTLDEDDVADQCELFVLSSSDKYAAASRSCVDEACADIERCLERLADEYDTTARIFAGELSF